MPAKPRRCRLPDCDQLAGRYRRHCPDHVDPATRPDDPPFPTLDLDALKRAREEA